MLPAALRRLAVLLFEGGLLRLVFEHARNMAISALITAAGLEVTRVGPPMRGFVHPTFAGYVVATLGLILLLLNLLDGLWKLSRLKWHLLLQWTLCALYVLVAWRVAQLVLNFQVGQRVSFNVGG